MTGADLDPPVSVLRDVVTRALAEDFGTLGDLTSIAVIPEDARGVGRFVARREGIVAGTAAATETYRQVDPEVRVTWTLGDGREILEGEVLGSVDGPLRSILAGERTALNLLQHCSGIATLTRRFVRSVHGRTRILDTRKTLPGLRALQKAAVRAGGGFNHRESLSDAVLIKDNHLRGSSVSQAVQRATVRWPGRLIACECDSLTQVEEAVNAGAGRILLDNMSPEVVAQAVALVAGAVPLEVSGGVTLEDVAAYAEAGPDYISVGAITHSAPALDIGLDLEGG